MFITKKDKNGNPIHHPITPPTHQAIINYHSESPSNKLRHAQRLGSVLASKSKNFAKSVNDKRKQIESDKKERIKSFDDAIDEILDDASLTAKQKFRRLQRFAHDNRKQLTDRQVHQINHELMQLDLKHDITPDPVEHSTKASHDKNPNPVTFASLQQEHDDVVSSVNNNTPQEEIDKKADKLNEIEHQMNQAEPTKDEKALNDIANEMHGNKAKSKLSDLTQAEIDLEKKGF